MSTTEETTDGGFELEVYEPGEALARAEAMFPQERREQIAQFLEVPADHPAFLPFLAIAAAYHLNPTMGEIWLIPENIREKVGNRWETTGKRYKPSVGRDGLLSIARRDPSYVGIKHDVVCEHDTFVVKHDTTRFDAPPEITHVYAPKEAGKSPKKSRGAVIGAWAILYLRNRPPVYYFADAAEHARTKTVDGVRSYTGAWEHTSQMLIKAAMSYVLRLGIGVTGLLPADEMMAPSLEEVKQGALLPGVDEEPGDTLPEDEQFWADIRATLVGDDDSPAHAEQADAEVMILKEHFADAEQAEIQMRLTGLEEADLRVLVQEASAVPDAEVVDEEPLGAVASIRERIEELRTQQDATTDDEEKAALQDEIEMAQEALAAAEAEAGHAGADDQPQDPAESD